MKGLKGLVALVAFPTALALPAMAGESEATAHKDYFNVGGHVAMTVTDDDSFAAGFNFARRIPITEIEGLRLSFNHSDNLTGMGVSYSLIDKHTEFYVGVGYEVLGNNRCVAPHMGINYHFGDDSNFFIGEEIGLLFGETTGLYWNLINVGFRFDFHPEVE